MALKGRGTSYRITTNDGAFGTQVRSPEGEEEAGRLHPRGGKCREEVQGQIGKVSRGEPPVRHQEATSSEPQGPEASPTSRESALHGHHGMALLEPRPSECAAEVLIQQAMPGSQAKRYRKLGEAAEAGSPGGSLTQRNRRVHPQNKYAERAPDFAALAARDAQLRPFVSILPSGRGCIDFSSYEACR